MAQRDDTRDPEREKKLEQEGEKASHSRDPLADDGDMDFNLNDDDSVEER